MRPNKQKDLKAIFKRDGLVTVDKLCRELGIKEPMCRRYLGEVNAKSSVNKNGKYYILSEHFTFNENGLLYLKDVTFYKGGNQQEAIRHLTDQSLCGMTSSELSEELKSSVQTLLPKMFRDGKITRQKVSGVRGLVYISSDPKRQKQQIKARKKSLSARKEAADDNKEFDADMVIDTFVTMIKKPHLTAKGVALSLQRKGRKITSDKVKEIVEYFDISKKNF